MMEFVEAVLSALGLKLKVVVAGAVGSFVSLQFFEGLSREDRWLTFFGGWALAAYLALPLTEFFELKPAMEQGISLAVGLFGMSLAAALIKAIRDTKWSEIIRRKTGGGE